MATLAPSAAETDPSAAAPAVRLTGIRRAYGDVVAVAVEQVGALTTGVVRGLDRMREAFER